MSKSKGLKWGLGIAGTLTLVAIAVLVVVLVVNMQGETHYVDANPPTVKVASATCQSTIAEYAPLASVSSPQSKSTRINMILEGEKVKNLGLEYTATYEDAEAARGAYNHMSTTLGPKMSDAGFKDSDAFNNQFTLNDNKVLLKLYAEKNELVRPAAQFFGLKLGDDEAMPRTKKEYFAKYADAGFRCKDN